MLASERENDDDDLDAAAGHTAAECVQMELAHLSCEGGLEMTVILLVFFHTQREETWVQQLDLLQLTTISLVVGIGHFH